MRQVTVARPGHDLALHLGPRTSGDVAVLVLPALGVPARKYFELCAHFADLGLVSAALDLRGHGASRPQPSRSDRYGYEAMVADLRPVIDRLRTETTTKRLILVGHSLGGQLALLNNALHDPYDTVLVGSGLPYWRDYGDPKFRYGLMAASRIVPAIAGFNRVSRAWSFGGPQSRGVMADWGFSARAGCWPRFGNVDPMERLGEVPFRMLAVHVENDTYTPPAPTLRLVAAARSATTTEIEYTEAEAGHPLDHFAWVKQSEALAARIAAWAKESEFQGARDA